MVGDVLVISFAFLLAGPACPVFLFISFAALPRVMSLTYTRSADHLALAAGSSWGCRAVPAGLHGLVRALFVIFPVYVVLMLPSSK